MYLERLRWSVHGFSYWKHKTFNTPKNSIFWPNRFNKVVLQSKMQTEKAADNCQDPKKIALVCIGNPKEMILRC